MLYIFQIICHWSIWLVLVEKMAIIWQLYVEFADFIKYISGTQIVKVGYTGEEREGRQASLHNKEFWENATNKELICGFFCRWSLKNIFDSNGMHHIMIIIVPNSFLIKSLMKDGFFFTCTWYKYCFTFLFKGVIFSENVGK